MAEIADNNVTNAGTSHTPFDLNCGYHRWMSYKKKVYPCLQSKLADKLSKELRELMVIYCKTLHHAQKFQKRAHNAGVQPWSYVSSENIWLNSKYIKTKQNHKLEAKFFGSFQMLHPVGKQAYKLEFSTNGKIHNIFHVSLLEQDTIRKKHEFLVLEVELGNNKEYAIEAIQDSTIYAKEANRHLPGLYYLVAWKD